MKKYQKCKNCGSESFFESDKCPFCGARIKKSEGRIGFLGLMGRLIFVFFILGMICTVIIPIVQKHQQKLEKKQSQKWKELVVIKDLVNLRSGPGTKFDIIGQVKKGEKLFFLNRKHNWINIRTLETKLKAWVYEKLVASANKDYILNQSEPKQKNKQEQASRDFVIPYDLLTFDGVKNPQVLNLKGWNMGKQIHKKYGFTSQQQQFIDYTKILDLRKKNVDNYLGKPVSHIAHKYVDEYIYKASFGYINVEYENNISFSFDVVYSLQFQGYIDILKSIGIHTLKRPFAVNEFTLLYNSNMGNNLITEYCAQHGFVNIGILIPHPSRPREDPSVEPGWKIFLNL